MAMVDLAGVYKVTAKGRVYFYAWRGKGAPRLYAEPGSAGFVEELAAALATRTTGDRRRISGLCAMYRASPEWTKLSDKTHTNWSRWLDRIQIHFGPLSIKQFSSPIVRTDIRDWRNGYSETPRAADMGLQVMSRLMTFAVDEGLISTNPCAGMAHLYRNDRSDIIWTGDDLAALEQVASREIVWAAKLAAFTSLRQGDLLRLSWGHVKDNAIEVRTRKTGSTALVPLYAPLRELLAAIPRRATTILTSQNERPWGSGFGASWQRAVKRSGVDKHFHDFRGTAATKFYLAGLSIKEIAGILAWSETHAERIIDTYVRRDELLRDRIRRLDENEARAKAEKPSAKPVTP